jgi:hypothetical protein
MLHNTDKQTYSIFNRKNVRPGYVLLYDYLIGLAPGISLAEWRLVETAFEVHRYKQNELILNPGEVCRLRSKMHV